MKGPPDQPGAESRHDGDGQNRRANDRKGLGAGERVKEFALLPGHREDRHEGEHDDRHREENRATNLLRSARFNPGFHPPISGLRQNGGVGALKMEFQAIFPDP